MNMRWVVLVVLASTSLAPAKVITSINGKLPDRDGWKMTGTIPGQIIVVSGKKVLELKDEATAEANGYAYRIADTEAERILEKGYTLTYHVRQKSGDAHQLIVRLKGLGASNFILWRDEKKNEMHVRSWDYDQGNHVGVQVGGVNKAIEIVAVWRPGSPVQVTVNGRETYAMSLGSSEGSPLNSVEIGAPDLSRHGQTIVEFLEMTSP